MTEVEGQIHKIMMVKKKGRSLLKGYEREYNVLGFPRRALTPEGSYFAILSMLASVKYAICYVLCGVEIFGIILVSLHDHLALTTIPQCSDHMVQEIELGLGIYIINRILSLWFQ